MINRDFLKAGHLPTLLAAFFYFDMSFMVWVLLGALAVQMSAELGLEPAQKGFMVALPVLAGALLRVVFGVLVDRLRPRRAGITGQVIVIGGLATAWFVGVKSYAGALTLGLVLGVAGSYGSPRGIIPESVDEAQKAVWIAQHGYSTLACVALVLLGVGMLAFAQRTAESARHANSPLTAGLNAGILASAALVAFAGRDLSFTTTERPLAHEHMIQLFIYNYTRQFPSHLDYRPMFTGFAVVLFVLLLLAGVPRVQKVATYALIGGTFWLSAWALNVYMIDLTPHWSQRELIKRYYSERTGPNEPLIACQMNWKGENIYTGNRVYKFVQLDNKAVTKWLDANKGKRAYFVLEHSRLNNFKRMMGKRTVEPVSTMRENNKFILVRAHI